MSKSFFQKYSVDYKNLIHVEYLVTTFAKSRIDRNKSISTNSGSRGELLLFDSGPIFKIYSDKLELNNFLDTIVFNNKNYTKHEQKIQ